MANIGLGTISTFLLFEDQHISTFAQTPPPRHTHHPSQHAQHDAFVSRGLLATPTIFAMLCCNMPSLFWKEAWHIPMIYLKLVLVLPTVPAKVVLLPPVSDYALNLKRQSSLAHTTPVPFHPSLFFLNLLFCIVNLFTYFN